MANPYTKDEININDIKHIINKYNPQWVNLSGGEPLLYSKLTTLLEYLKSRNIKIKLYTTGYIHNFNKTIIKIKDYIDTIVFPYYSNRENIFNFIVNAKHESFRRTKSAIETSIKLNINTEVHIVPMTINLYTLEDTINELLNMGVKKVNLLKLVNQGRCTTNEYLIVDDEVLMKEIDRLHIKFKDQIKLGIPLTSCKECVAGKEKLVLMCNNQLIPCESYKDGICKCERLNHKE